MPTQASQLDYLSAFLDTPVPIGFGVVRGSGKLVLQHELSDKTRIACYLLARGRWNALLRLWINRLSITLPDTTKVHFHPGEDGEIGAGMAATSTGGDQKVDAFWASLPGSLSPVTFSRYAHLWVKAAPDPGAPGPELEVLGDYEASLVRIFDNAGVQTSFAFSQNWVWCALHYLLETLVMREARVNQPLTVEQKALFDFGLLKTAADYADFDIGGGVKRFSDGGLVWIQDGLTADRAAEQLLLMCRSYLGERNGKIFIMERKDEASSFTLTLDDIEPGSFVVEDGVEEGAYNQIIPVFRDLNLASGSSDNLTRMAEATPEPLNHESHQLAVGFAGKGLARIRDATPLSLDLGVNTPERAWRIGKSLLLETLGDEADPGAVYAGLKRFSVTALEHTVEIVPGDVVTIDRGVSEEWSGTKFRVQKAVELPDGRRQLSGRQHNPNAYPDTAPAQQATEPPAPGTGIVPVSGGGSYSYRTLKNVLRASDAGANATIYVEDPDTAGAFVNRVAGIGDLSINAGTITAQSFSTLVHVYYTDTGNPPTGGAKAFGTASTKEEALNGLGRFYLGSIQTPADGAPDTRGNNDSGAGAQVGGHIKRTPTTETTVGTVTGSGNAKDGDWSTKLTARTPAAGTGNITSLNTSVKLSGFGLTDDFGRVFKNLKLTVKANASVGNESDATGTSTLRVRYSVNGGAAWTDVRTATAVGAGATASLALQTDVISLPDGTDPAQVQVEVRAEGHTGGANNDGDLTSEMYEAVLEGDL